MLGERTYEIYKGIDDDGQREVLIMQRIEVGPLGQTISEHDAALAGTDNPILKEVTQGNVIFPQFDRRFPIAIHTSGRCFTPAPLGHQDQVKFRQQIRDGLDSKK